jgi:hypothetical protein
MTSSAADSGVPRFPPFAFGDVAAESLNTGTCKGAVGWATSREHPTNDVTVISSNAALDMLLLLLLLVSALRNGVTCYTTAQKACGTQHMFQCLGPL